MNVEENLHESFFVRVDHWAILLLVDGSSENLVLVSQHVDEVGCEANPLVLRLSHVNAHHSLHNFSDIEEAYVNLELLPLD